MVPSTNPGCPHVICTCACGSAWARARCSSLTLAMGSAGTFAKCSSGVAPLVLAMVLLAARVAADGPRRSSTMQHPGDARRPLAPIVPPGPGPPPENQRSPAIGALAPLIWFIAVVARE